MPLEPVVLIATLMPVNAGSIVAVCLERVVEGPPAKFWALLTLALDVWV